MRIGTKSAIVLDQKGNQRVYLDVPVAGFEWEQSTVQVVVGSCNQLLLCRSLNTHHHHDQYDPLIARPVHCIATNVAVHYFDG